MTFSSTQMLKLPVTLLMIFKIQSTHFYLLLQNRRRDLQAIWLLGSQTGAIKTTTSLSKRSKREILGISKEFRLKFNQKQVNKWHFTLKCSLKGFKNLRRRTLYWWSLRRRPLNQAICRRSETLTGMLTSFACCSLTSTSGQKLILVWSPKHKTKCLVKLMITVDDLICS